MKIGDIVDVPTDKPAYVIAGAVLALLVLVLAWRAALRLVRGKRAENVLTVIAALIATTVQADGMWIFFRDIVHAPVLLRIESFAFLEIAMFVSGLRARQNIRETPEHTAGADGAAVWVIAFGSATLASTAGDSLWIILLRYTAAAVSAWLWERGLTGERRRARKDGERKPRRRINWRVTPERVLVFLGFAEATDRTAGEVDAHRRLTRVALAVQHLRTLRTAGARRRRLRRAERRLDATMRAAIEYTNLADDEDSQEALLAQIGALAHARELAEMDVPAPWAIADPGSLALETAPPAEPPPTVDPFPDDVSPAIMAWLRGEEPPRVPVPSDPHQVRAVRLFADEVRAGRVPGIKRLQRTLGGSQGRAYEVQAYLADLAEKRAIPEIVR
ncbi:hypothetical protein [Actinoallomurus sp. CA-142502]|uniref:hypothetical protein n=1 Tax=Actinoallomurus sp. CA-142502 TaxID=3239885 RepID=UPI003D8F8957